MKRILYAVCVAVIVVAIALGTLAVIDKKYKKHPTSANVESATTIEQLKNTAYNGKLRKALSKTTFNGSAILVKNSKIVDSYTRGNMDDDENVKNNLSTTYEIDSLQKSLTAALIMKEINKGKLSFDDKLSQFYPEIAGANLISIRMLLNMTSGLSLKELKVTGDKLSNKVLLKKIIKNTKFNSKRIGDWNYQPVNFMILSEILQKITKKTYAQLFKSAYIDKLHLKETEFAYETTKKTYQATGYNLKNISGTLKKVEQNPNRATVKSEIGTGQVYMSVADFYKVISSLLSGKILGKENTKRLYLSNEVNKAQYYGGLYMSINPVYRYANGYGYGFQDNMRISEDGKNAVIVFSNYQYLGNGQLKRAVNNLANKFLK